MKQPAALPQDASILTYAKWLSSEGSARKASSVKARGQPSPLACKTELHPRLDASCLEKTAAQRYEVALKRGTFLDCSHLSSRWENLAPLNGRLGVCEPLHELSWDSVRQGPIATLLAPLLFPTLLDCKLETNTAGSEPLHRLGLLLVCQRSTRSVLVAGLGTGMC